MENSAAWLAYLANQNKGGYCRGAAVTGVVLGGAALAAVAVGIYSVNQASKARAHGAEETAKALNAGQTEVLRILATQQGVERTSREAWQNANTPTMTNYIDVAAGAGAGSGATSTSTSEAILLALASQNNSGQVCPNPVALYTPAQPFNPCCNG